MDELRRAYRKMLRETHPDTGGDAKRFHAVQYAWDQIGTEADRASYDRRGIHGRSSASSSASWGPSAPRKPADTRPPARSFGHPGGINRERYLGLMREWVGRGAAMPDPYDPALVRSAPRDIRHLLADALAEEATASSLSTLGIGFTLWHDVATDAATGPAASKLDHIVLGPTGLFAVLSEDWGGPVTVRRNELVGETIAPGERPLHGLALRAKAISRAAKVRFTALVIVVPDDAIEQAVTIGRMRGVTTVVVHRSRLLGLLREGLDGVPALGGTDLFEVRTRLQSTLRFV